VPIPIIMPKFGFNQETSEILEWLKKEGTSVDKGDPVAVVSTEKVSMEVEAPESGILAGLQFKVGETVKVASVIAYIVKPGEKFEDLAPVPDKAKLELKENKKESVEDNGTLITPVASKLAQELGVDLGTVTGRGPGGRVTREDVELAASKKQKVAPLGKIPATPAAKRVAGERGIILNDVSASGPAGVVVSADILKAKMNSTSTTHKINSGGVIPFNGMRKAIALNMQHSYQEIPHITLTYEVDMQSIGQLRDKVLKSTGNKISYTALIVKAVGWALKRNPMVNSRLETDQIILLQSINIGIAVAIESGLIVPVLHDVDAKNISEINVELEEVTTRASNNRLRQSDLQGGTFTISNLGMYGADKFTSIINPPEVAILAVGRIRKQFVADEMGQPILRPMASLTLSADHRVLDGIVAARFMTDLRDCLEQPGLMVI
jgi:pyruvate dehydrogenase E2 component (dihydrolipoamide acetyltransferase)